MPWYCGVFNCNMKKGINEGRMQMKMRVRIALLFMLLISLSYAAEASVSLGVSPGVLNYRDVLKGGYAQRTMTIQALTRKSASFLWRAFIEWPRHDGEGTCPG